MNIYESINKVMGTVGAVGKDSTNSQQNYKFRGIDAVMNALSPALVAAKIFVVPEVLEQTREERVNAKGNTLIYSIAKVKYTFYAEDGSYITATVIGEGMDTGDKSMNKAMSAAFKYACFQTFCIPTEEMVDSEVDSHEVAPKTPSNVTEEQVQALKKEIERIGWTAEEFCKWQKINAVEELKAIYFDFAMSKLTSYPSIGKQ